MRTENGLLFFHTMAPAFARRRLTSGLICTRSPRTGNAGGAQRKRTATGGLRHLSSAARKRETVAHDSYPASRDRPSSIRPRLPDTASASSMRPARSTSMPPAAPRCRASATAIRTCSRRCTRRSTGSPTRTPASSPPRSPRSWPTTWSRTRRPAWSHVYLVSGGSEAIEAALKLARQYFVEIGEPQRQLLHRAAPELSRQHARRARGRRQRAGGARQFAPLLIDDASRLAVLRIPRPARRRDAARPTASGWRTSSRPRSSSWAARTSSPSSPRPWSARRWARCRRCPATSAACARSATGTASC